MTTIGYNSIDNVLLNISDPNTGGAMTEVPGVSSPKINAGTSIYNEQGGGTGIAGWSADIYWTAIDYNTVRWSTGTIYMPDGDSYSVTMGNTGDMAGTTYIYYDMSTSSMATTQNANDSVGENKLLMCVATPNSDTSKDVTFQAFGTNAQSTFIYADNIASNTITANEIAANTITASEIATNTITANKMNVSQLSGISADLGSITAGTISGTTITAGSTSSGAVKLYPYSSTQGRIDFYAGGSIVGYIYGKNVPSVGDTVFLNASTAIVLDGDVYILNRDRLDLSQAKLRIPVGTNLY